MTKTQFGEAVRIAQADRIDLSGVDDSLLHGCGLPDFKPVYCTVEQVAKLVRWNCMQLNGELDAEELNNVAHIARRKFLCLNNRT